MVKFVNARLPLSHLNSEMVLILLARGRFVVVHLHATLSTPLDGTTTEC